jgi:hypothetical protein
MRTSAIHHKTFVTNVIRVRCMLGEEQEGNMLWRFKEKNPGLTGQTLSPDLRSEVLSGWLLRIPNKSIELIMW